MTSTVEDTSQILLKLLKNFQEDVEAARALGYHTIWFNENKKQDSGLCQPSVEIHSLDELVDAVALIARSA